MASLIIMLAAVLQDPGVPQQIQKRVQAETDQTVRRINTMLRALSFHRLDTAEENRVLEEMAVSLSGLSKDQMTDVLKRLEAAAKTPDAAKSKAEVEEAYAKHRDVLVALGRLLARYDAVRSLDQAAERLDRLSADELELQLQSSQLARVGIQIQTVDLSEEPERAKVQQEKDEKVRKDKEKDLNKRRDQRNALRSGLHQMAERLSDEQFDLHRNAGEVMIQLAELKSRLPKEQVDRLEKAEMLAQQRQLVPALDEASKKLRSRVDYVQRYAQWKAAAFLQWKSAGDLRELARALRAPVEDVEALRDARRRVEQAIERQTALRIESSLPPESKEAERLERRGHDLGNRQARAEFEARDTRVLLLPRREALAERILPAEEAMRAAQAVLRDGGPAQAEQERATAALRAFLGDLDKAIAEAEKAERNKVEALKKVKEEIEKLIQDQKDVKKETEAAKKEELPKIAPKEEALAARTEALRQEAIPEKQAIEPALQKAEQAMEKAAEALQDQRQPDAAKKQEQAIAALEEAKKAVDQALADAQKEQNEALPSAAQQVAKALEQAKAAQENNKEAAQQTENKPSLAEQQKNLAQEAQQANQPAAPDAQKAAEALAQGDLPQAVQEQKKALAQLQKAAAEAPGQPEGKQAGELAQKQEALLNATEAAAEAQAANAEAQAATAQAQATAPQGVQPALDKAAGQLAKAQAKAQQGQPAEAAQADGQAAEALQEALDALNAQLEAMGLPAVLPGQATAATTTPGAPKPGQPGQEPGQGEKPGPPGQGQAPAPGQEPGQKPGQGQGEKPGPSQEQNASKGKGERQPDGMVKNGASQLQDVKGGDSFLHLPPRQRELIRQSLSETMPGEYSSLIQQYYVNLARGRAANGPAVEERKK